MDNNKTIKFVISYNGVTFDSDQAEYMTLDFLFDTLESAKDFKVNFPKWCYENNIVSEDEMWDRTNGSKCSYVSIQDIPEFGSYNFPFESFVTLYKYDTGWFYLNENVNIIKITEKTQKEIVA